MSLKMDKYASYYTINELLGPNGKLKKVVTYVGPYYRYQVDEAAYQRMKAVYAALAALCAALYFGAAFVGASAMGTGGNPAAYVAIPFVFLLFPLGMFAGKAVMLLPLPQRLEFPQYDKYVKSLKTYLILLFSFSAATLLGQLCYLVFSSPNAQDFPFAALAAAIAACAAFLVRFQGKYACTPEA